MENALRTDVLGLPAPTGVSRALPGTEPPAGGRVRGRTHYARGGSACGASNTHLSYGQPAK